MRPNVVPLMGADAAGVKGLEKAKLAEMKR